MNYTEYLNQLANRLKELVENSPNCKPLHTDDYGWVNHRYESDLFRLAHVERYADGKIEVLHFTTFPNRWSPEPIFGFDVITTEKVITGAYMDLSPIIDTYSFDEGVDFRERKPIPERATVFSDRFIMLKPESDEEFIRFCDWVVDKYDWYLNTLLKLERKTEEVDKVIDKQNTYCKVQASNPRTYSALKALIGAEKATYFMENILFPKIEL
jgi:hypothetical protein